MYSFEILNYKDETKTIVKDATIDGILAKKMYEKQESGYDCYVGWVNDPYEDIEEEEVFYALGDQNSKFVVDHNERKVIFLTYDEAHKAAEKNELLVVVELIACDYTVYENKIWRKGWEHEHTREYMEDIPF